MENPLEDIEDVSWLAWSAGSYLDMLKSIIKDMDMSSIPDGVRSHIYESVEPALVDARHAVGDLEFEIASIFRESEDSNVDRSVK